MSESLIIISVVVQLVILEGILSIDNAAVLAALASKLPDDEPPPRPFNRRLFRHLWTNQQSAALKVGIFGAYVGRLLMLMLASLIIRIEFLPLVGGAYLIWLAIAYFREQLGSHPHERVADSATKQPVGRLGKIMQSIPEFWRVVIAIELADLAFSLDNVIAAVALSDKFWVVVVGVFIGMAVMRFAATLFVKIIVWEPAMKSAAYLLLVAIGCELALKELAGVHIPELVQFSISAAILGSMFMMGRVVRQLPVYSQSTWLRQFLG